MKRSELGVFSSLTRRTSIRVLVALGFLYMLLVAVELPFVLRVGRNPGSLGASLGARNGLFGKENLLYYILRDKDELARTPIVSGLNLTAGVGSQSAASESAKRALDLGGKLWREIESVEKNPTAFRAGNRGKSVNRGAISNIAACPDSISLTGEELKEKQGRIAVLPCGLTLGSHVTVIGRPTRGHSVLAEPKHKDKKEENGPHKMVSQFVVELLALKMAEGEDPPRVMRFNPWIQGDRTGKPVITLSICYRKQWGAVQRCDGRMSEPDEGTVDGLVRCEKWSWHHDNKSQDSAMGRLSRLMGGDEPSFPFAEEKLFMLTLTAGSQGYHMSVDGRHVASFPNRQLFKMEDVSMGMWVQNFNKSRPVEYVHNPNFIQLGCAEDYTTAHYQTPTQMACLWNKLFRFGSTSCCWR